MDKIKKFIKEMFNINNVKSMVVFMLIVLLFSELGQGGKNALIAGATHIIFGAIVWLFTEYCKPFRDFFSKQNNKQND